MKHLDPKEQTIEIAGLTIENGFADGEFLKIEFMSPLFSSKVSADGEVTRVKLHDERAKVSLTLMQSSEHNAELSALATLDKLAPNGAGVGPFLMRDRNGTTNLAGPECWVSERPAVSLDKEPTTRTWIIEVAKCRGVIGGN
jgi:hypothetical protein